jgi:hypothetical protein
MGLNLTTATGSNLGTRAGRERASGGLRKTEPMTTLQSLSAPRSTCSRSSATSRKAALVSLDLDTD